MTDATTTEAKTAAAPRPTRNPVHEPTPLPAEARAKFLLLQGQSQDAREAVDSAHRRVGDLITGTASDYVAAVMAWLDPDAMLRRLTAEIDALSEPKLSLSDRERDERLAELREQIDALERSEEALIVLTHERDGVEVLRRADASPLAVLSVARAEFKRGDAAAA